MNKPKAWTITDLSEDKKAFSISKDHASLAEEFIDMVNSNLSESQLTRVDDFIVHLMGGMEEDPIAHEHYSTLVETKPTNGAYSSLHFMLLGGKQEQSLHYHPPVDGDLRTSDRFVLVYPLWNVDKQQGGITFEWFGTQNPKLTKKLDKTEYPVVEGDPIEPKFHLDVPPGHVALVKLEAGVHRFRGEGLAISVHPLDIDKGSGLGTLVGNTAGYEGDTPILDQEINVNAIHEVMQNNSFSNLQRLFATHVLALREYIEKREQANGLSMREEEELVERLRGLSPPSHE